MRLQRVTEPPYFFARCVTCQQPIVGGDKIADLDGPAFETYYHDHPSCLPKGVVQVPNDHDHDQDR